MTEGLMEAVRKAETLIGDFINEAEYILETVKGTEAEAFDSIDELKTVDNALAGAFRFHTGNPKESGYYLALSRYNSWYLVQWSEKYKKWNSFDEDKDASLGFEDGTIVAYFDLPDGKEYVNVGDD